ncbi:MAG: hypothetical protein JWN04_5402 [Myxococcaceae bacterium]|nr:hypothetical protein [Myxococcaceae bacterium]
MLSALADSTYQSTERSIASSSGTSSGRRLVDVVHVTSAASPSLSVKALHLFEVASPMTHLLVQGMIFSPRT